MNPFNEVLAFEKNNAILYEKGALWCDTVDRLAIVRFIYDTDASLNILKARNRQYWRRMILNVISTMKDFILKSSNLLAIRENRSSRKPAALEVTPNSVYWPLS